MRTLGETRLWYSVFLTFIGFLIYIRWGYKVVLALSVAFALLFLWINFSHPEAYEKTLMPALQSPWFIPHVIAYILSYSVLGLSWLVAVVALFMLLFRKFEIKVLDLANNLVYMGFSLLTIGMVIGAIWAKEAWGHYWTWDPKETWAFLTWLTYLLYIHYRYYHPKRIKSHLWILSLIFVVLLICWFGLSYLPSAQNSVHVYAR
jgi:ABC-type transport system involved in cytochrome c biogenesis permease subunit